MLLLIVGIIGLVVGITLYVIGKRLCSDDYAEAENVWDVSGSILWVLSGILIGIVLFLLVMKNFEKINLINDYNIQKPYIESCYENNQLTEKERLNVIEKALQFNVQIIKCKSWRDNNWIGCFYVYSYGDLPLFDVTKIKHAAKVYRIGLDK